MPDEALRHYGQDDLIPGQRIVDMWQSGDEMFTWMGRKHGGRDGAAFREDLRSGKLARVVN